MDITIVEGHISYLNCCVDILVNSELGQRYFSEKGSAQKSLEEGFSRGEIYVALDKDNNCKGFVWVILNGIFHSFPYIHIIAVKIENRGQGIGKILLNMLRMFIIKTIQSYF
jgi:ribosomal protein S18 acetylase RimI-like enzyme